MNSSKYKHLFSLLLAVALVATSFAQSSGSIIGQSNTGNINTITTAVPFLLITPDARAGGMGDVGAATEPDANSIHWNPAKLVYNEKDMGFAISYTPWLREIVSDINLSYLSGYKKLTKRSALGVSLRYFTLGQIQFTDEFGRNTTQFRPNEFAVDAAYSMKLSDNFSGGISLRYVNSNLSGNTALQGGAITKAGQAVAADVSAYYQNSRLKIKDKKAELGIGGVISNIGNKIAYTQTTQRDFLPINLRLGTRLTYHMDDYNKVAFSIDFNKLMVPTEPIYSIDSTGGPLLDSEGNFVILSGQDPDRAIASGMFGSFTDAPGVIERDDQGDIVWEDEARGIPSIVPGSRFREEMNEINIAVGVEYTYNNLFSVRGGYFYEHVLKGNRKYFTLGAGIKYNVFTLDFAYLIPAYFNPENYVRSPLQNTLRFSLLFDFAALKDKQKSESE